MTPCFDQYFRQKDGCGVTGNFQHRQAETGDMFRCLAHEMSLFSNFFCLLRSTSRPRLNRSQPNPTKMDSNSIAPTTL